jgi:hypothetical protein
MKKILFITISYAVIYYFFVHKLHAATGQWYWNLFDYFGKIPFLLITVGYFLFGLFLERSLNRTNWTGRKSNK